MTNNLEIFDRLWSEFIGTFKGAMRRKAKNGRLNYDEARTALAEVSLCWQNDLESEGRWVSTLSSEEPAKGRLVRKILTQDMHITAEDRAGGGFVVPAAAGVFGVGGGVIGYGMANLLGMGTAGTIATTAVPLALGAVIGSNYTARRKNEALEATINGYASQLDSFYHAVVATLNA